MGTARKRKGENNALKCPKCGGKDITKVDLTILFCEGCFNTWERKPLCPKQQQGESMDAFLTRIGFIDYKGVPVCKHLVRSALVPKGVFRDRNQ